MLETMNSKTVLHFWYETLMRQPEDTAITWFSEFNQFSLNYQQLEDQSNALALQFKERGISRAVEFNQTEIREPIIGVYCKQSSPLWMVASLAAWKVGAAVLLLDFTLKPEDLKYRISNVNTSLVITDEPEWPETPETWMYFNIAISPILTSGFFYRDHQIDPSYLAYIAYTSGSTGKPKAVALNHAGIPGLINSHREIMRLNEIDKVAHISSLNFDPSWMNFFLLLSGTPCVLWNQTIDPQLSLFFNNNNITASIFVPTTLASLKSSEFKTLSKILTTGEEASIALLNEWSILLTEPTEAGIEKKREIFIGYGPTEHTVGSMLVKYTNGLPYYLGNPDEDNIDDRQVFLLDPNDGHTIASESNPLKEIFLAGLGLARGYIKEGQLDHKAMEGRFITTKNSNNASQTIRVYCTGDFS